MDDDDALAQLRHTLGAFRGDDAGPLAPTPSLAAVPALVAEVRAGGVRVDLAPLPDAAESPAATLAQKGMTSSKSSPRVMNLIRIRTILWRAAPKAGRAAATPVSNHARPFPS